jgi:hypothetical protein
MVSTMARLFQFVNVTDARTSTSPESRRSNHSHIMREVHAKKRRLQVQRFRHEMILNKAKPDFERFLPFLLDSSPQGLSGNKDPFSSFARPLLSGEHNLLNYCK